MTHDNDERLAAWLADGPAHGPAGGLESALSRTRSGGQRPGWLVAATGGTIAQSPAGGQLRFGLVAVALLLVTLVAGALIAGGLLPKPDPAPSPAVIASPELTRCVRTAPRWSRAGSSTPGGGGSPVARRTARREFSCYPVQHLHRPTRMALTSGSSSPVLGRKSWPCPRTARACSSGVMQPNGDFVTLITDGHGSEPRVLNMCGEVPCEDWGHTFSPDGSELAFVRPGDDGETVIAIMHLRSGVVEELESTRVANPDLGDPCHTNCGAGYNERAELVARWHAPRLHALEHRHSRSAADSTESSLTTALFIVDADGSNFRQLKCPPSSARWIRGGRRTAR